MEAGRRRRLLSTDTEKNGAYYLNNWISHEEYLCEKPTEDKKMACMLYELLALKWSRALEWLGQVPRTPETATLEIVIGGYRSVWGVLAEDDRGIGNYFLDREMFQVRVDGSRGGYLSLLEEEGRRRFSEVEALSSRIHIVKQNIEFLSRFAGSYQPQTTDSYLQLAFRFLSNDTDQE